MKISVRKLREVIQSVIREGIDDENDKENFEPEKLLKKWELQGRGMNASVTRELAARDIIPIRRGETDTNVLGAGMYNTVFDVVYKGKRAATRVSTEPDELESFLKFISYKDRMPAKYAKHFPHVYTTFEFQLDDGETAKGAVVELLSPLPTNLKHDLRRQSLMKGKLQKERVYTLISDPNVIEKIAKECSPRNSLVASYLVDSFNNEVAPFLKSSIGEPLTQAIEKVKRIIYSELEMSGVGPKSRQSYYDFAQEIVDVLYEDVIPTDYGTASRAAQHHPASSVREFYDFLLALHNVGMSWSDLHSENFMMRKGTGDLVVVDPGLFEE